MNKEKINNKIQDLSWRLAVLEQMSDNEEISISKYTRARQRLIAELHSLRFALGKCDLDSDKWFKDLLERNNANK